MKDLFEQQRAYLNYFYDHLDLEQAERFFQRCLACKGILFFAGVGKSGIVAEKIAMTLVSTGTRALCLSPTNVLHGDIGVVSEEDVVVLISKNGETEELLTLLPFLKRRQATTLAIVSNPSSRLAKGVDLAISLPIERELCPFDLAPTISTSVQLNFGDVLAMNLMRAKKVSLEQYALSHPAGSIGKKATLTVADLMLQGDALPLCLPSDRLTDVLVELSDKKSGCLLVTDAKKSLLGIFTDGDLRRALQTQGAHIFEQTMQQLMNPAAVSIHKEMLAVDAMKLMQRMPKKWISSLPVIESGQLIGMIRIYDIIQTGL